MSQPQKTVDEVIKETLESMNRQLKEGEKHVAALQQTTQQLQKLSDELKKLAQELSKPVQGTGQTAQRPQTRT